MQESKYQQSIYKHFGSRMNHAAITAVAGSGKTYTAIESIGKIPTFYSVLLAAFNTTIRDEFRERCKAKGYRHVRGVNFNGFGWSVCLKNLRNPELEKDKTRNTLEFAILKPNTEDEHKFFNRIAPTVERVVSLLKNRCVFDKDEAMSMLPDLYEHHNIETPSADFDDIVVRTFDRCIKNTAVLDFDDQKYYPLLHGWDVPVFDNVIVDEFQDTSEMEMQLLLKAAEGGLFYGFGDPDQAIYGFKGATPDQFDRFISLMNADTLPLSICYRCPKAVVEEAKLIVPRIESAPGAIDGVVDTIRRKDYEKRVMEGDFVLCRTTEPLVKDCLAQIKAGRLAKVRGREIGDKIQGLINQISGKNQSMDVQDFITRLLEYKFSRGQQLAKLRRDAEIIQLEDRVNTIRALADGAHNAGEISANLDKVFSDDHSDRPCIDYLSIHKSKGLQRKKVFVLRPDLLPHPAAKKQWMMEEERRLKYVAITRAEEEFFYVDPR